MKELEYYLDTKITVEKYPLAFIKNDEHFIKDGFDEFLFCDIMFKINYADEYENYKRN